jgi:hypothetical protein
VSGCEGRPPEKTPSYSAWEIHEVWWPRSRIENPADERTVTEIEASLDRTACELVVQRKIREAVDRGGRPMPSGAMWMDRSLTTTTATYVCRPDGDRL